ncbi:phospholipase membrane-associated-like, partial [Brachionus plicatilis]
MHILTIALYLILNFVCIFGSGFDKEYIDYIFKNPWKVNEKMTSQSSFRPKNIFNCNVLPKSKQRPTSVHALRPQDIEIISAIGDSLTAANGAKATTILGLIEECRGVSWSMGSENPDLSQSITLPNILKKFNPNLYGASTGSGPYTSDKAGFNMAKPGETSHDMMTQAIDLVAKMKASPQINFNEGWKLVTIFVGGNDLCHACENTKYNDVKYLKKMREVLDYFKSNSPRTLINLVVSLDVSVIDDLNGNTCRNMQNLFCKCALSPEFRNTLLNITKNIQIGTEQLINSGIYDTTDDFTVVAQPFMKKMKAPQKDDGSPDYSYFSPDCFHFSTKGHEASAIEIWRNMLTPVGQKAEKWINLNQPIPCPSEDS